jgi:hypothetical protein
MNGVDVWSNRFFCLLFGRYIQEGLSELARGRMIYADTSAAAAASVSTRVPRSVFNAFLGTLGLGRGES